MGTSLFDSVARTSSALGISATPGCTNPGLLENPCPSKCNNVSGGANNPAAFSSYDKHAKKVKHDDMGPLGHKAQGARFPKTFDLAADLAEPQARSAYGLSGYYAYREGKKKVEHIQNRIIAWASRTAKGLLSFGDKKAPTKAIILANATDFKADGSLSCKGNKHSSKAPTTAKRDGFVGGLKSQIAKALPAYLKGEKNTERAPHNTARAPYTSEGLLCPASSINLEIYTANCVVIRINKFYKILLHLLWRATVLLLVEQLPPVAAEKTVPSSSLAPATASSVPAVIPDNEDRSWVAVLIIFILTIIVEGVLLTLIRGERVLIFGVMTAVSELLGWGLAQGPPTGPWLPVAVYGLILFHMMGYIISQFQQSRMSVGHCIAVIVACFAAVAIVSIASPAAKSLDILLGALPTSVLVLAWFKSRFVHMPPQPRPGLPRFIQDLERHINHKIMRRNSM